MLSDKPTGEAIQIAGQRAPGSIIGGVGERTGAMDSATPRIETAIQDVETKLSDVRRRMEDNRVLLTAVKRGNQRLQLASDMEARRAMVLGRISLYMENIPQMPDLSEQQERLKELRLQEGLLDEAVSADTIQAKMESCLSNVNQYLWNYAKQIDLEYSDTPLRLDPRNLTIVADTPERPVPMREIGSGENHVGYHIVAHLSDTAHSNPPPRSASPYCAQPPAPAQSASCPTPTAPTPTSALLLPAPASALSC